MSHIPSGIMYYCSKFRRNLFTNKISSSNPLFRYLRKKNNRMSCLCFSFTFLGYNNDFRPFNNGRGNYHNKRNDFRNDRNDRNGDQPGIYRSKDYQQNDDFGNRGGYRSVRF
jgi:hypothetical protein